MRKAALLLALGSALQAADLTGIWVGRIPTRNGEMQDVSFQFVQKGEALTGKMYGDYGSTPISEGKVNEYHVDFVVVSPEQAGNQINTTVLRFHGCLLEGRIDVTRERERSTNAGNSGGVQFRGSTSVSFQLKRLI